MDMLGRCFDLHRNLLRTGAMVPEAATVRNRPVDVRGETDAA